MRDVLASRSHRSYDLAVRLVCESVQAFTCAYEQGLMGTFYCLYADHIFLMTVASVNFSAASSSCASFVLKKHGGASFYFSKVYG